VAAILTDPLELPCGLVLANRLGRAAMTEGISDSRNDPTERHARLYEANARGGAGLVLTGNAMVDRRHLERARNIVIDAATDAAALRRMAAASAGASLEPARVARAASASARSRSASSADQR
jgi:2,4-dienoyl-CoA reductase-like NADH-dependent reductase (Old Yellow Enzyme family)